MSLSLIAVAQREKEAKSLNAFLTLSLIGSLALHIGVLSLGLGKFLSKVPEVDNEPIEIAIVELPSPPKLELKQENKASGSGGGESRSTLGSSGSSAGFGVASGSTSPENLPIKITNSNSSIAASTVVIAPVSSPKLSQRSAKVIPTRSQNQKIKLEKVPAKIVTQQKPVVAPTQNVPSEIVTKPKPVVATAPISVAKVKPIPVDTFNERSSQVQQLNNQRLNNLLAKARNSREQAIRVSNSNAIATQQGNVAANLRNQAGNGVGTGNSTGNELRSRGTGTGNGTGTGTNNRGTGSGNGTGIGNGTGTSNRGTGTGNGGLQSGSTVATATRNTERPASQRESNSNSTNTRSSGRLACRTCSKPKYPENARKRRLEGKAEISVDVDKKGNVTNVRLAQTSGHAELDKAAVEQARNWKFNTPNGAAQGVTAKVDFAIEGSRRSRQNQERRRRRVAIQKKPVASSQNTRTQPANITKAPSNTALRRSLRRRAITPQPRRRIDTLPPRQAFDKPQRQRRQLSVSQTRLRNTLRRQQRAVSPNQTTIRRQQPQAISPNQTKLRQSLRLYKQSQSTPTNNSNEP